MGSLYISYGADEENLFNNQYLVYLAIIPFILITRYACLSSDSVGEIVRWSLCLKGFNRVNHSIHIPWLWAITLLFNFLTG